MSFYDAVGLPHDSGDWDMGGLLGIAATFLELRHERINGRGVECQRPAASASPISWMGAPYVVIVLENLLTRPSTSFRSSWNFSVSTIILRKEYAEYLSLIVGLFMSVPLKAYSLKKLKK